MRSPIDIKSVNARKWYDGTVPLIKTSPEYGCAPVESILVDKISSILPISSRRAYI